MSPTPNSNPTKSPSGVPANFYRGARLTWHQRRRHALVRRLMKGIEGKRILDYGCGYGDLTFALSKSNSVVGIDVDADRVAFARSQYPELEFHQFDGVSAPFPDASFDVVMSCVVLPFVSDCQAHLQDIERLLRPDGILQIVTVGPPAVRGAVRRLFRRPAFSEKLHLLHPAILREHLKSLGFSIQLSDFFYDPPFVNWNTSQKICFGMIDQCLSLCRVESAAPYFAYRAQRES